MHGSVRELEANMEQLSLSQQYANRGIYLLCKVRLSTCLGTFKMFMRHNASHQHLYCNLSLARTRTNA